MPFEATALLLAWGAITVLAFAMAGLLRQVRTLTALVAGETVPAPGPSAGQKVPPELLASSLNGAGPDRTLVFMDGECPGCAAIAPELGRLADDPVVDIYAVFPDRASDLARGRVVALEGMSAAYRRLQVPATPFAVHVGAEGLITDAAPIGSAQALRRFVERQGEEVSNAGTT